MKHMLLSRFLLLRHKASGLLDESWYLEENPDVATSGQDALGHFCRYGVFENRAPHPDFNLDDYLKQFPKAKRYAFGPMVHYAMFGYKTYKPEPQDPVSPEGILRHFWGGINPLPVYPVRDQVRRITMVTSGIDSGSLFGGVGTAILFSALLANRLNATLRLVAQDKRPDTGLLPQLLRANGVQLHVPLETAYCPLNGEAPLSVAPADYFIGTSWWTVNSLLGSVSPDRICYILQEDERMFYAMGDFQRRCEAVLRDARVPLLINTKLLYDYLNHPDTGIGDLTHRAVWFEPAFPMGSQPEINPSDARLKLMFYARPQHHARSMFYTGLEALDRSVQAGVFSPDAWDFYFVGKDIPKLHFPGGPQVFRRERMDWPTYHQLVRQMDAGFSLMHSPHPSYIPLDLASVGAVSLTNAFGNKTNLESYSKNIITANLDMGSLVEGLIRLEAAAHDRQTRLAHWNTQGIGRDWSLAFEEAIQYIQPRV